MVDWSEYLPFLHNAESTRSPNYIEHLWLLGFTHEAPKGGRAAGRQVNQRIVTATDTLSWSCQKCANVNRLEKENYQLRFIFVNEAFIYISYKGNVRMCINSNTVEMYEGGRFS